MTRAGGQTEQPGDQIPDDRACQGTEDRRHGDNLQIDNPFADRGGDRRSGERAGQVEKGGHGYRLARCQDLGRDDRRDRVGGIMKAVDVLKNQRREDNDEEKNHPLVVR